MANPSISIRVELEKLELVKDFFGLDGMGETVRKLVNDNLVKIQNGDLGDFATIDNTTISVQKAAEMLGYSFSNIKEMIYKKKLKAFQPGGKNSVWRIYLSSVKVLLVPNVTKIS